MEKSAGSGGWRALRRLGHPARPVYDRIAGHGHVLPDFLIIGAMKAGTSSLYAYLSQHPQVMGPSHKEVHFFDHSHARGAYWYRRHFPTLHEVKARERRCGSPIRVGEATPYYLYHPAAAARIYALLPRASLIVLLRDPVARAFSHYRHVQRQGLEPLSFTEALAAEGERLAGSEEALLSGRRARMLAHQRYSYRSRGLYLGQLQRYFERMPAAQILVIRSEDMFANPQAAVDEVIAFLGLESWRLSDSAARNQAPEGETIIPGETELRRFFEPHNRRLADFLGRDMGW